MAFEARDCQERLEDNDILSSVENNRIIPAVIPDSSSNLQTLKADIL